MEVDTQASRQTDISKLSKARQSNSNNYITDYITVYFSSSLDVHCQLFCADSFPWTSSGRHVLADLHWVSIVMPCCLNIHLGSYSLLFPRSNHLGEFLFMVLFFVKYLLIYRTSFSSQSILVCIKQYNLF